MRNILFILFVFIGLDLQAQTTWYIDPDGSNASGDGTIGNPWASLYKATSTVPSLQGDPGDIIHVNAGTYNEYQQSQLAVDISIEGEGVNSIIRSGYAGSTTSHSDALISLSGGVNTAQHISNLTIDGNSLFGNNGINVYARDNVDIYQCVIKDFAYIGIYMWGAGSNDNNIHNNIITNSGGCIPQSGSGHHPNIYFADQTSSNIYNNTITQTARASNSNGEGIAGYEGISDCKIYNNNIICQVRNGTTWSFAIELWYVTNECEWYDNYIVGEIDLGKDVTPGAGAYGLSFHDNTVDALAVNNTTYNYGIQFEQTVEGIRVYNNLFKNHYTSIHFEQYNYVDDYVDDVDIYNNIIYNCANTGGSGYAIYFHTGDNTLPQYVRNVNIYNNTIIGHATYIPDAGIMLPSGNVCSNFSVRNNIIQGFNVAPIYENQTQYGTMTTLSVENNLFYNNGHSNTPYYVDWVPSNYTYQNNVLGEDPEFVNATTFDFHLASTSPAIDAGYASTLSATDYDGVAWGVPSSIGAFEYTGVSLVIPTVTTTAISAITGTTATGGGNVTSSGGASVTARGICWSLGHNPTTSGSHTSDGTGTGVFTSSLTGLVAGLTYYVRAYATNSVGTAYGNEVYFVADVVSVITSGQLIKHSGTLVKIGTNLIKE